MNNLKTKSSALLIIGNGFDRALGYKTSYLNFYESEQFEELKKNGNSICKEIKKVSETSKWSDLEDGLYVHSLTLMNRDVGDKYSAAERFNAEFNEIKSALYNYLLNVERDGKDSDYEAFKELIKIWKGLSPQVISFNYTPFIIEEMTDGYNDDEKDRFKLIHGSLDVDDPTWASKRIVLGIDDHQKVDDHHSFLYKSNQFRWKLEELQQTIDDHTVYLIHGCSMGKSDEIYFKMLFDRKQIGKRYLIYGKDEDGVVSMRKVVNEYIEDVEDFYYRNEVIFLSTDDFPGCIMKTARFVTKKSWAEKM